MPEFDQYGQIKTDKHLPIVTFSVEAKHDKSASEREGRPIFRNVEMVNIVFPADRQRTIVRPAHAQATKIGNEIITYAMKFPEQYKRFKADQPQVVEGTPLSEAPFLDTAQRAMLKALSVYTIEQLASLQGQALKNLGPGGLALQQKAHGYLEAASGTANVTAMSAKIASLEQTVADLSAQGADPRVKYAEMGDDKLKEHIREHTGQAPRGNPSRATLIRMCIEAEAGGTPTEAVDEAA